MIGSLVRMADTLQQRLVGRTSRKQVSAAAWKCTLASAEAWLRATHPGWNAALFDHGFFTNEGSPILERLLSATMQPSGRELAEKWVDMMGTTRHDRRAQRIAELAPVAEEFMVRVRRALMEEIKPAEPVRVQPRCAEVDTSVLEPAHR